MNTDHYIEFGGGLGDVFNQIYRDGGYTSLDIIPPDERVTVGLVTHNPHVRELFDHHPAKAQLDIRSLGYWCPSEDATRRAELGIPKYHGCRGTGRPPIFWESVEDKAVIDATLEAVGDAMHGWVVLAPSGGQDDRTIPRHLAEKLVRDVHATGRKVVQVGRNYDRIGRSTEVLIEGVDVNLIDRLTVPGVVELVKMASGLITGHSSLNILAWHERVPQVLLYPESVRQRHFLGSDQWSFGAFDQRLSRITLHGLFADGDTIGNRFHTILKGV